MIFCLDCVGKDGACCDFCRFYDFNGNEFGIYIGKGYCNKSTKQKDPEEVCEEFHCVLAK